MSPLASSKPDGLEKVGADKGLNTDVRVSAMANGPLAGYSVKGVHDNGLSTGVAGVIGVTIVFGAAFGLSKIAKASRSRERAENTAA